MEPVGTQEAKCSFESVRLVEFHGSVPVTVFNVCYDTVYGHDTGEIAESLFVRVFGIILLRLDENVIEIHIDGLAFPEQAHPHVEFYQQFVQFRVGVELVFLSRRGFVACVLAGKLLDGTTDGMACRYTCVGCLTKMALLPVHVFHAVSSAEINVEHGRDYLVLLVSVVG